MSEIIAVLLALAAIPAIVAWIAVTTSNRLVSLDARCKTAHADIDVHLKRRADLIPGLVETVRGFAAHEAGILSDVMEARKVSLQIAPEARAETEAALGRKVGSVLSLAERYPAIAASPHFCALRQELVATEERLTAARRFFNLAVEEYNATLARFPGSLVAARRRLAERRPFDLGVERMVLDEPATIRF